MARSSYDLRSTVCFVWGGLPQLGQIVNKVVKNKKYYYDIQAENGKLYEDVCVDSKSEKYTILTHHTDIVVKSLAKRVLETSFETTIE